MFDVCNQLAAEDELMEPVLIALGLWESIFKPGVTDSQVQTPSCADISVTVDYIEVMMLILKLMWVSNIQFYNIRVF